MIALGVFMLLPTSCSDVSRWFWTGVTPDRFADTVAALHKRANPPCGYFV